MSNFIDLPTHEKTLTLDNEGYNVVFYLDDLEENPKIFKVEVENNEDPWVQNEAEEYAEDNEEQIIDEYLQGCRDYEDSIIYDIWRDR